MSATAIQTPDSSALNMKAICKKINKLEEKRKSVHSNLYVRSTMFLRGAVFQADKQMIDDIEKVLTKDYNAIMEYLRSAKKELQSNKS